MRAEIRQMDMKIMKVRMDCKVMKLQCQGLWVRRLEIYFNIFWMPSRVEFRVRSRPSDFLIFSAMVVVYFLMEVMQSEWDVHPVLGNGWWTCLDAKKMAHVDVHHLCDGIYALVFQESCELRRCKSCAETNVLPSNWVHAHESTFCFILHND